MPLSQGDLLGHYKIQSMIGRGGMGEVYRALDMKLERDVAIKVLPAVLANDRDRLSRFEREAKVLAQLNHPGIATIHGVEDRALVMELVPGPTLADRIAQGPIPLAEAEQILLQIADALEYAHERGVIHRDLKPANIKIDPDDRVKILDFGLAKALSGTGDLVAGQDPTNSPTVTVTMGGTVAGTILGTAAYMAPEQARGKKVDRRADIWAFGVVVWEMLTGERLFKGEDTVQVLSRVLEQPVDLDRVPPRFRNLLARCLDRNPKDRLRDIGEARFLLAQPESQSAPSLEPLSAPSGRPLGRTGFYAAAMLALISTALALWLWLRPASHEPAAVVRIATSLPLPLQSSWPLAISRDGTRLAYIAGPNRQIYYRTMDQLEAHPLPGADGVFDGLWFSPDGQQIAYVSGSTSGAAQLKKITLAGGAAQTLSTVQQTSGPVVVDWGDVDWAGRGNILYADSAGLWQIPSTGGNPASLLKPDGKNTEIFFSYAQWLPGDKEILVSAYKGPLATEVFAYDPQTHAKKSLLKMPGLQPRAQFIAGGVSPTTGYIAYYDSATASLMALALDVSRLTVSGVPVNVLDGMAAGIQGSPFGAFAVSNTGTLIYVPGAPTENPSSTIVRVDRKGKEEPIASPPRSYRIARESPTDPNRIAVTIFQTGSSDIWVLDAARGTLDRITSDGRSSDPVWTPDGKRIIYHGTDGQTLEEVRWAPADRSSPPLVLASMPIGSHAPAVPYSVSADGKVLFGSYPLEGKLWTLPLDGSPNAAPRVILESQFSEFQPAISPDGHWLAYQSNESGRSQTYVTSYPEAGPKVTISTEMGIQPSWSHNGRELFYIRPGNSVAIMAIEFDSGPPLRASRPNELFPLTSNSRTYDVEPDAQHFLMVKPQELAPQAGSDRVTIVFNWFEELRRRAPLPK